MKFFQSKYSSESKTFLTIWLSFFGAFFAISWYGIKPADFCYTFHLFGTIKHSVIIATSLTLFLLAIYLFIRLAVKKIKEQYKVN